MSLDPEYWPDSSDMNRRLEEMGYETMISCWPRFMKESANYDFLEKHGWFMKDSEGHTVYGTPDDQRGALIDTTDPACGKWYFETIRKNYADLGYKYWWTDEDEPDISPHESFLSAGTGARIHNIYPLTPYPLHLRRTSERFFLALPDSVPVGLSRRTAVRNHLLVV